MNKEPTLGDIADLVQRHVLLVARKVNQVHGVLQIQVGFAVEVKARLDVLDNTYFTHQRPKTTNEHKSRTSIDGDQVR